MQYQEEINQLRKEIDKYHIDLEIKEKRINESKYYGCQYLEY